MRPGDDFFRYTNGKWLDRTPIAPDQTMAGLRRDITDRVEARLHEILEEAAANVPREPSDLAGKAGAFYRSFLDEERIEQLGHQPIAELLGEVAAATRPQLASMMGRTLTDFPDTFFSFRIDVDLKDPQHYAVYLGQGGLGLPNRDYYLQSNFAAQKARYLAYIEQLLRLAKWPEAEATAKEVMALETAIAEASWTRVQQRDTVATYNPLPVEELQRVAPGFAWHEMLGAAGLGKVTRVIVGEKTAFPKIAAIYARTPLTTLRAWQAFHIADNAAPYLSKPFADAHFELRQKTIAGQQQQKVRWKRAVFAVSGGDFGVDGRFGTVGTLGFGVGQLYTAKYFGPEAKAKIEALVSNVKGAFRARIERLEWMSAKTKDEALKKLDGYTVKVGYPDKPRDYSKVVMVRDDLAGNVRRAATADWTFQTSRLFGPVDRTEWAMTPQTNDAYNGSLNDIVFPAGFLQAPVFDAAADPAVNYGAIGAVIGHELTHGFDDEGRKIDSAGTLRDWWTREDDTEFRRRAERLGRQYDEYEPFPGARVNGKLTMGENVADLGGLTMGLEAYQRSLGGRPAPVLDGFTGVQRVFLGWAQVWCTKATEDAVRQQVVSDPHSPRQYRVNGVVRNLDAWYEAFQVKTGERLYIAPEGRVRIW